MNFSFLDWSTIFIILHSNIYHFGMRFLAIQDKKNLSKQKLPKEITQQ